LEFLFELLHSSGCFFVTGQTVSDLGERTCLKLRGRRPASNGRPRRLARKLRETRGPVRTRYRNVSDIGLGRAHANHSKTPLCRPVAQPCWSSPVLRRKHVCSRTAPPLRKRFARDSSSAPACQPRERYCR